MRVIAGEAKGRPLVAARGGGTRSATDRIRETLFAILTPRLQDAVVLDLFAGAGTLGIEALSRGAARATFVEHSRQALAALRQNLRTTKLEDRAEVVATDVVSYLGRTGRSFDLVLCDPPFADVELLGRVLGHEGLRHAVGDGLIVARVHRKHPPAVAGALQLRREHPVGEESLLLLEYIRP